MKVAHGRIEKFDQSGLYKLNEMLRTLVTAVNSIEIVREGTPENVFCDYKAFGTPITPNTEFSISHSLGRVPMGYIVVSQTATGNFYDGSTSNTSATLYLRCNTASVSGNIIII
jgi:hypothetical protein